MNAFSKKVENPCHTLALHPVLDVAGLIDARATETRVVHSPYKQRVKEI
jgi:hypothetical protein